ncbi:MAG: SgcJ/EcaC family oxidoreductase [Planctomycetes bacterium]|nr:SgcJ/EcaC family oxidoreductase [Planctomycetota bacterium]
MRWTAVLWLAAWTALPVTALRGGEDVATPKAEEKAVRQTAAAYARAFNAGDAKAIAALWTADGELVDEAGKEFRGRKTIEKEFAAMFATSKGLTAEIAVLAIRFPAKDLAIDNGIVWVRDASGATVSAARYLAVLVRQEGKWLIASVRETPHVPASNHEHLKDLAWLVGDWHAKGDGKVIRFHCVWEGNKNFLGRTFVVEDKGKIVKAGRQIIGWDPLAGQVRSWTFDDEGGFGGEMWTRDGDRWLGEATGVMRNGRETRALNIITRLDDNTFTWQSVRRGVNGTALPDSARITVERIRKTK